MTTKNETLSEIGRNAYSSLADMVSALSLDWDRLEELRSERDDWDENTPWEEVQVEEAAELAELEEARGEAEDFDDAQQRISEDPLEVTVREGWHEPGAECEPGEFCILLTTGGPAVRIMGELDNGHPTRAYLQVQDWGTPWTDYLEADSDVLLTYAQQFYFGE